MTLEWRIVYLVVLDFLPENYGLCMSRDMEALLFKWLCRTRFLVSTI